MKGLICVVLVLGLLISALETGGQPVPDQEPAQPEDGGVVGTRIQSGSIVYNCPK